MLGIGLHRPARHLRPERLVVAPVTVMGITNAVSVTASGLSTCAVLADGTAKCWGSNTNGQLGNGKLGYEPGYTSLADADHRGRHRGRPGRARPGIGVRPTSMTAGCAAGAVPDSGRLGQPEHQQPRPRGQGLPARRSDRLRRLPHPPAGVRAVRCREHHGRRLARLRPSRRRTVWCWGANGSGQLGNGSGGRGLGPEPRSWSRSPCRCGRSPRHQFTGGRGVAASSPAPACWTRSGQTLCVGDNSLGMLGFGGGNPIIPGFANVISQGAFGDGRRHVGISAGGLFNCAPLTEARSSAGGRTTQANSVSPTATPTSPPEP